MKLLLDTHALLWAVLQPPLLSRRAAALVSDKGNEILISAASAWEIATKVRLGKLPGAEAFERDFLVHIAAAGYAVAPITPEIALRAGRLPGAHKDLFDRMLAAHAVADDVPIVSIDAKLDGFGARRFW